MKKLLFIFAIILLLSLPVYAYAEAGEEAVEATPTVTETIVGWCTENILHIFSGTTVSLSIVIAYLFKKGLVPSLAKGLSNINGQLDSGVLKVEQLIEKLSSSTDETLQKIAVEIYPVVEEAKKVSVVSKKMEECLKVMQGELDQCKNDRAILTLCLKSNTDFLYSVFMSANLPAYQKEQMGERYNEMNKLIAQLSSAEVDGHEQ